MKVCPKCNKEYESGGFCQEDGTPLIDKPVVSAPPTSAQKIMAGGDITHNVSHHSETNVYNQDETKQVRQCVVTGRTAVVTEGAVCRKCGEWALLEYVDLGVCSNCRNSLISEKKRTYQKAFMEALTNDQIIDFEERSKLDLLASELSLDKETVDSLELEIRNKELKAAEALSPRDKMIFNTAQRGVYSCSGLTESFHKLQGLSHGYPNNAEIAQLFLLAAIEINPKEGLGFLAQSSLYRSDSVAKSIRKIELYERLDQHKEADDEERFAQHAFGSDPLFKAKSLERLIDLYMDGEKDESQLQLLIHESLDWVSPCADDDPYFHFVDAYLAYATKKKDFLEPTIEIVQAEYFCQRKLRFKPNINREYDETDAEKQFDIGIHFATGQGVEQNYAEALKWFSKAAESSHPEAIAWIADFFRNGYGVEPDQETAEKWYEIGAKLGNEKCIQVLNEIRGSKNAGDAQPTASLEDFYAKFKQAVTNSLGEINDFFVGNEIASDKLINASARCLIPLNERVIALIDTTVMGSAKNGLLFTANGNIFMHNAWSAEKPGAHSVNWEILQNCVCEIYKKRDYTISIGPELFGSAGCSLNNEQILAIIEIFRDLYQNNEVTVPTERKDKEEDINSEQLCANFKDFVFSKVGKVDGFYIGLDIPSKKLTNAKIKCQVSASEDIVALIDSTVMGSAKNALLFSFSGSLYFHNDWAGKNSGAHYLVLESWIKSEIKVPMLSQELQIGDLFFDMSGSSVSRDKAKRIIEIFRSFFE